VIPKGKAEDSGPDHLWQVKQCTVNHNCCRPIALLCIKRATCFDFLFIYLSSYASIESTRDVGSLYTSKPY